MLKGHSLNDTMTEFLDDCNAENLVQLSQQGGQQRGTHAPTALREGQDERGIFCRQAARLKDGISTPTPKRTAHLTRLHKTRVSVSATWTLNPKKAARKEECPGDWQQQISHPSHGSPEGSARYSLPPSSPVLPPPEQAWPHQAPANPASFPSRNHNGPTLINR